MNSLHRLAIVVLLAFSLGTIYAQENVVASISTSSRSASMSNGLVSLTINSKGHINKLVSNGKDLINANSGGRFYFSYNDQSSYMELSPDAIRMEKQNDDYAEVVYSNTTGTLQLEQGFILRKGVSGVYMYIIVKGTSTQIKLREMRVVYRVDPNQFTYGYITEAMQGTMPSVAEMKDVDGDAIMDATYPLWDGSIYTKYNWANYIDEDSVHGIMSATDGVWAIAPSTEFMNGGPMKQELTVHATNKTPLVLQMLQGEHFGAAAQYYSTGMEKMYGPFLMYANSGTQQEMIADAQQQASLEKQQWPYTWLTNDLYPIDRSTVKGRIRLGHKLSADKIKVVLAKPGADLYDQGTDYMFWTNTDANGYFSIPNVRAGSYSLYAYATQGEVTEEFEKGGLTVSGEEVDLGSINWAPIKLENLEWMIGENNRKSDGYKYSDTIRQYGLYELPPADLTYTMGSSTPEEDWYYAQTKVGSWNIKFNLDEVPSGSALLTASIAGATASPKVDVYINGTKKTTWSFGNDAAVYRSAVLGGDHALFRTPISVSNLKAGENTITLKMTSVGSRGGVMYDCLKFETGALLSEDFTAVNDITSIASIHTYPNPFEYQMSFRIQSKTSEQVTISVFNLQGKMVDVVFDGKLSNSDQTITWNNASGLPAGIYIYRIQTANGLVSGSIQKR